MLCPSHSKSPSISEVVSIRFSGICFWLSSLAPSLKILKENAPKKPKNNPPLSFPRSIKLTGSPNEDTNWQTNKNHHCQGGVVQKVFFVKVLFFSFFFFFVSFFPSRGHLKIKTKVCIKGREGCLPSFFLLLSFQLPLLSFPTTLQWPPPPPIFTHPHPHQFYFKVATLQQQSQKMPTQAIKMECLIHNNKKTQQPSSKNEDRWRNWREESKFNFSFTREVKKKNKTRVRENSWLSPTKKNTQSWEWVINARLASFQPQKLLAVRQWLVVVGRRLERSAVEKNQGRLE